MTRFQGFKVLQPSKFAWRVGMYIVNCTVQYMLWQLHLETECLEFSFFYKLTELLYWRIVVVALPKYCCVPSYYVFRIIQITNLFIKSSGYTVGIRPLIIIFYGSQIKNLDKKNLGLKKFMKFINCNFFVCLI